MKTDAEILSLSEKMVGLEKIPLNEATARFLELSSDCTIEELGRLAKILARAARSAKWRADIAEAADRSNNASNKPPPPNPTA